MDSVVRLAGCWVSAFHSVLSSNTVSHGARPWSLSFCFRRSPGRPPSTSWFCSGIMAASTAASTPSIRTQRKRTRSSAWAPDSWAAAWWRGFTSQWPFSLLRTYTHSQLSSSMVERFYNTERFYKSVATFTPPHIHTLSTVPAPKRYMSEIMLTCQSLCVEWSSLPWSMPFWLSDIT